MTAGQYARVEVAGQLFTNRVTFTAADPAQGWGGIRFSPGAGGVVASSVIERVRGYGGTALTITGASPTIRDSRISDSPCCGVTGVSISGSGANPVFERNIITLMSGAGVSVSSYAQPRLINNRIGDNTGDGIIAGHQSTVFLAPEAASGGRIGNDVYGNAVGVRASGSAYVNYGWYFYGGSGYHNDGYNNVVNNRANGNVASSNSALAAGNSGNLRRNGFYRNALGVAGGLDVQATGSGSRAYVNCNYWGPGATPPFRTASDAGAALFNASYLADDPRVIALAPCLPFGSTAGGEVNKGSADEDELSLLADAASMENASQALAALVSVITGRDALVAPGIAEIGWVARRSDAPAEAVALLEAYAAGDDPVARRAALSALVGVYGAAGDGPGALRAADGLVATRDPDAMLDGQTARVYLLTEAGRAREASDALQAATALAPRAVEVRMAQEYIARATGQPLTSLANGGATDGAARFGADADRAVEGNGEAITEATLGAAQPNPVIRAAVVPLDLPSASHVRLALYDVLGREALVLVDGYFDAGRHRLALDAGALAPGMYLLRAIVATESGTRALTARMTVQR